MSLDALPKIPRDSRRHLLVRSLREAIVVGSLRPGDRLVERDISERMGISRGPVREALRQLEQEGLVVSFPYRGTEVVGISHEEVAEILVPIRLTLERFAFRRALQAISQQDLEDLENLVGSMNEAAYAGDLDKLVEADVGFHELVISRSGQLHCGQIWRTISPRVRAYFYQYGPKHDSLMEVAEEHRELLDALKSMDIDRVLRVLDEHILATIRLDDREGEARGEEDISEGGS